MNTCAPIDTQPASNALPTEETRSMLIEVMAYLETLTGRDAALGITDTAGPAVGR